MHQPDHCMEIGVSHGPQPALWSDRRMCRSWKAAASILCRRAHDTDNPAPRLLRLPTAVGRRYTCRTHGRRIHATQHVGHVAYTTAQCVSQRYPPAPEPSLRQLSTAHAAYRYADVHAVGGSGTAVLRTRPTCIAYRTDPDSRPVGVDRRGETPITAVSGLSPGAVRG